MMQITEIRTQESEEDVFSSESCPKIGKIINELNGFFPGSALRITVYDGHEFLIQLHKPFHKPFRLIEAAERHLSLWAKHDHYFFGGAATYRQTLVMAGAFPHDEKGVLLVMHPDDQKIPIIRAKQVRCAMDVLETLLTFSRLQLCLLKTILAIEESKIQRMEEYVEREIQPLTEFQKEETVTESLSLH